MTIASVQKPVGFNLEPVDTRCIMDSPNFNGIYGMTAHPLRQVFMLGAVWRLSRQQPRSSLDILEIGSWSGASALTWGEGINIHNDGRGSLTCIDAWKPYYAQGEFFDDLSKEINEALSNDEPYRVFMENIKHLPATIELTVHRDWSGNVLPTLKDKIYDLIYISMVITATLG